MSTQQPKHLQHSTIPSILSYDHHRETYVIGDEARAMGVRGITNAYGFKELIGKPDTEYERPSRYWIAPTGESDSFTKTLSAREVAKNFLSILLRNIQEPAKLIIGIPAIGDEAWLGNYKRHIKELLREIGRPPPDFFFEPFAVYQFYRNRYQNDGQSGVGPETVLIIDVGGSTFDSLIVRTTKEGYLPRSGPASRPLGARGEFSAGRDVDLLLLDRLVDKAKMMGHKWKDDPRKRILVPSGACILPVIEDAKIGLSNKISRNAPLKTSYADYELPVKFPAGTLHQDDEIATILNGDDLKQAVDAMWTTRWKDIVFDTIAAAEKTLANVKQELGLFERVFVAGGCANLPFFSEELWRCIKQYLRKVDDIIIGKDPGNAVAEGIAYEVKEQSRRSPELKSQTLGPCMFRDLYVAFRQARTEPWAVPKALKAGGRTNAIGHLVASPVECGPGPLEFDITLPFSPSRRLFYAFFTEAPDSKQRTPLNPADDAISLPDGGKTFASIKLSLTLRDTGDIEPTFSVKNRVLSHRKEWKEIIAPPVHVENAIVEEGDVFVGVDFGHSYSYITRLLDIAPDQPNFEFPIYAYTRQIKAKLSGLNDTVAKERDAGILTDEAIVRHARRRTLNAVFHSNKIEGIKLTLGETEEAIGRGHVESESPDRRAAVNLQETYLWVIAHASTYEAHPEVFIRGINQMLLKGVHDNAGQYRDGQVRISGLAWSPPMPTSVGPLMGALAEELARGPNNRSVLEFAATVHTKLVTIHPFFDGNGRTARLLVNAVLVRFGWPAITVRFDDRDRYLLALEKSNKGNIGELITLFIGLCKSELDDIVKESLSASKGNSSGAGKAYAAKEDHVSPEQIRKRARQINLGDFDDPLAEVLRLKEDAERSLLTELYEQWVGHWLNFLTEVKTLCNEIAQAPQYVSGGVVVNVHDFGNITFESFCDMWKGQQLKESWFFSLEVVSGDKKETFMFYFDKDVDTSLDERNIKAPPVALFVARFIGNEYRRLSTEAVALRCLRVIDGRVQAFAGEGRILQGDMTRVMNMFLAEVIFDYLMPELPG